MNPMRVIAFPSVFIEDLKTALEQHDPSVKKFESCWHLTSTTSIAKELRLAGYQALQISHLASMMVYGVGRIVQQGDDPEDPEFRASYPAHWEYRAALAKPDERSQYEALDRLEQRIVAWEKRVSGRELGSAIANLTHLRRHLYQDARTSEGIRRALLSGRVDFAESVKTLSEAGFSAGDLTISDEVGLAAQRAWEAIESSDSDLRLTRTRLWIDLEEYARNETRLAGEVRSALESAFLHIFGAKDGGTILQHGFYFFTSPQWAIFQLLQTTDSLKQIFVVHDDRESDVYQTWRRYFIDGFGFAPIEYAVGAVRMPETGAARALRQALAGEFVGAGAANLLLRRLRTPVAFVNAYKDAHPDSGTEDAGGDDAWRLDRDELKVYAPGAPDIDRLLTRFVSKSQFGQADFSTVPIGIFLVRIHECIEERRNRDRGVRIDSGGLIDIVASGFLPLPRGVDPLDAAMTVRRALPFFDGCTEGSQWVDRARNLRDIIRTRIGAFGERDASQNDVIRIANASENFFRLAPWADLTVDEADTLCASIQTTNDLVLELIESEMIDLRDFASHLQKIIRDGLPNVPDEYRRDIEERVNGLRMDSIEAYAVDLTSLVKLLVSPPLKLRPSAIDSGNVRQFGAVDRLAYRRRASNLHITNLSDRSFPRATSDVDWPFRMSDLTNQSDDRRSRSVELLELRTAAATLGDLYLLWVALNGVEPENSVTLSYIQELGGEDLNPSPILVLLARAKIGSKNAEFREAIKSATGGIVLEEPEHPKDDSVRILPTATPANLPEQIRTDAVARLPGVVVSSALFCARRLALQWLVGPTASFGLSHLQSILFGNVPAAVHERHGISIGEGQNLSNELWRHLTDGQRQSSISLRRVKEKRNGGEKSAGYPWLFTIGLRSVSTDQEFNRLQSDVENILQKSSPPNRSESDSLVRWRSSSAYRAANGYRDQLRAAQALAADRVDGFLPTPAPGLDGVTERHCKNCPVSDNCSARITDD